jgi:hypothetical protein
LADESGFADAAFDGEAEALVFTATNFIGETKSSVNYFSGAVIRTRARYTPPPHFV